MTFRMPLKVRLEDVDQAGIVVYSKCFQYVNTALEAFVESEIGVDYPTLVIEHRIGLPAVHLDSDFNHPMRFGESFEVALEVVAVGNASITFAYAIRVVGKDADAVRGREVVACLDLDSFTKRQLPEWLRMKMTACIK